MRLSILLVLLLPRLAYAVTYYVATTGDDARSTSEAQNPGTPWKTIGWASNNVNPGDSVSVAAGTYNERVFFNRSGASGQPITFTCASNRQCIVDGGTQVTSGWTADSPTGTFVINNTAYNFSGIVPAHATLSDQMFVFVKPGVTPTPNYLNLGTSDPAWVGIEAACQNFDTQTKCRFQDLGNPNSKALKLAPQDVGAFELSAISYLTFDGFYFKNAYSCVVFRNFSHHNTLKNSTCTNGYYAVQLVTGAHDNLLQGNVWFLNWIYEDHGLPRYVAINSVNPPQDNVFQALRSNMPIVSSVKIIDAGDNNRIIQNIFDHTGAAGIDMWSTQYHANAGYTNSNTEIGHNSFTRCQDYCFQIQDTDADGLQIHDNQFSTYYNGMRFGRVLNGAGAKYYVYRNTLSNYLGCPNCGRGGDIEFSAVNAVSSGILPNGMEAYFYHNTLNSADTGVIAAGGALPSQGQNLSGTFWINNIMTAARSWEFSAGLSDNPSFMSYSWVGGAGSGSPPGFSTAPMYWNVPNRLWPNDQSDFTPPVGNVQLVDAGVNLGVTWSAGSNGTRPALPGMGTFVGSAPDVGAVERGAIVPGGAVRCCERESGGGTRR